jgi:RNA polymerase sigma-70 factor (ECF subfamily)
MLSVVPGRKRTEIPDTQENAIDEYALLERIIEGDAAAFEVFYKTYHTKLFHFILRMMNQPDSVEELIQETLLVVWQKPESFNHTSKISTWVFGIAYNKTLKFLSKNSKHSKNIDIEEVIESIGDETANPAGNIENIDWLNYALASLQPDQRAVIELTLYQGLAYQEIAIIMNCPENTVKTRMFHARKKLADVAKNQEN